MTNINHTKSKNKASFFILLGFFFIGLIWIFSNVVYGATAVWHLTGGINGFEKQYQQIQAVGLNNIQTVELERSIDKVRLGIDRVQKIWNNGWGLGWGRYLPGLSEEYFAIRDSLALADSLLNSITDFVALVNGIQGAVNNAQSLGLGVIIRDDQSYFSLTAQEREGFWRKLVESIPQLRGLEVELQLAVLDYQRVTAGGPNWLKSASWWLEFGERIQLAQQTVAAIIPLATVGTELMGINGKEELLILFLNETELRPGGGFIGLYGLAVTNQGLIESLLVEDVYNLEAAAALRADYQVKPPTPIKNYLGQNKWYFRDAAWEPDFSLTAINARQLLRQEQAIALRPISEISGVVGITTKFIAELLKILGPLQLQGEVVTADSLTDWLQFQVEQAFIEKGIPYSERKAVVSEAAGQLLENIFSSTPEQWPSLLVAMEEAVTAKELAVMMIVEPGKRKLNEAGWSGVLSPIQGEDQIMLVDANLGALKTDPVVQRAIKYVITREANRLKATVTIEYHHTGNYNYKTSGYHSYSRLLTPLGSQLTSSQFSGGGEPEKNESFAPEVVSGMTAFPQYLSVKPGEKGIWRLEYYLPDAVWQSLLIGEYNLQGFKQMGAGAVPLTIDLNFGKKLQSANPSEDPQDFSILGYQLVTGLNQDQRFELRFAP